MTAQSVIEQLEMLVENTKSLESYIPHSKLSEIPLALTLSAVNSTVVTSTVTSTAGNTVSVANTNNLPSTITLMPPPKSIPTKPKLTIK